MMAQTGDVKIRISVDGASAKTGLNQVESGFASLRERIDSIERSSGALTASLSRMGHAAAAAFSGRELAQAADAWSTLNAQLKIDRKSVV